MKNKVLESTMDGLTLSGDNTCGGKKNGRCYLEDKQPRVKLNSDQKVRRRLMRRAIKQGLYPMVYHGQNRRMQSMPGTMQCIKQANRSKKPNNVPADAAMMSDKEKSGTQIKRKGGNGLRRKQKIFLVGINENIPQENMILDQNVPTRLRQRLAKRNKQDKLIKRKALLAKNDNNAELTDRKLRRKQRKQEKMEKFLAENADYVKETFPGEAIKPKQVKRLIRKNQQQNIESSKNLEPQQPKANMRSCDRKVLRNERRKVRKSIRRNGMLRSLPKNVKRRSRKNTEPEMTIF